MTESPKTSSKSRSQPQGRKWRWLIIAAVLLVALIAVAPTLASAFFLKQIMGRVSREINGRIEAGSASLGWLRPVELRNVEGYDRHGNPLFTIGRLQTERSLWQLMSSRGLGTLHVHSSKFLVVTREDGSNLEDFLEPLLTRPPTGKPLDIAWDIQNARIEVRSSMERQSAVPTVIEIPELTGRYHRDKRHAWQVAGSLNIVVDEKTGSLKLNSQGAGIGTGENLDLRSGNVHLNADLSDLPLAALDPVIRRWRSDVRLEGTAHGALSATIEKGQAKATWSNLGTHDNRFFIASLSRDNPVILESLHSSGELRWNGDEIHIDSSITSDVGSVELKVASLAAGDSRALSRVLKSGNLDIAAHLDLPSLAHALPHRMGLRDDVSITTGSIELQMHSEPSDSTTVWTATLTTSDLAGRRGNSELVWPEPISANLQASWASGRLVIDNLECRSEFLTANLKGSADDAEVALSGDLERLAQRMQQFFELPAGFAGTIDGHIHYKRRPPEHLFDGQITTSNFTWNAANGTQMHEPVLVMSGEATLRQNAERRFDELSQASLQLVASDDLLRFDLKQAIALQAQQPSIPLALTFRGNLGHWKTRAQPFVELNEWSIGGLCDATGDIAVYGAIVDVSKFSGEIHDLVVSSEGVRINEPRVSLDIQGQWNGADKKWTSTHGEFATSTLSASADNVVVQLGETPSANGRFMVRADLTRLQNWFPSRTAPRQRMRLAGEFIGEAYIDQEAETTLVQLDGGIENFEFAQPDALATTTTVANAPRNWSPVWHEREANFNATARWRSEGTLQLHALRLEGDGWAFVTHGEVTGVPTAPVLNLEGTAEYNWLALSPRLRITAGETLTVRGQRHDPFQLKGPLVSSGTGLVSPELNLTASLGWDSARFQEVEIGAGEMRAQLENSMLTLSILDVPVSEGTLSVTPQIDLRQAPARLAIPPGTVLKDIQITPVMCRTWLKYALPTLADVPRAEGAFDLQFDEVDVPLNQPEMANVKGAIVLHNATLGAGPLTEVVLRISDALSALGDRRMRLSERAGGTWVEIPAQVVAFEMKDGRIVHRELQLKVRDLTIYSRGSVGVDQTYDLVLEVPIPEADNPNSRLASLAGRTYRFPLRGRFGEKVDVAAVLGDLARELARQSAGAAAESLLDEGLRRLFRDRQ